MEAVAEKLVQSDEAVETERHSAVPDVVVAAVLAVVVAAVGERVVFADDEKADGQVEGLGLHDLAPLGHLLCDEQLVVDEGLGAPLDAELALGELAVV